MCKSLATLPSFWTTILCVLYGQTVDVFSLRSRLPSMPSPPLRAHKNSSPQYVGKQYEYFHRPGKTPRESTSRREFIASTMAAMGTTILMSSTSPSPSLAASPTTIFSDKNFSVEDAKSRFQAARKDLKYLLDNYTEISKSGGGDAVRNYLGTQGVNSNLYGIQKILKLLAEESEDIVEYSEAMEEFNAYYFQAEGAAYQSLFAEHSSAKATPESCLATAQQDLLQMQKFMDQLAQQLNL